MNNEKKREATIPRIKNPATNFQSWMTRVKINVVTLATVSIHFAKVELPITYLGVWPFFINVPGTKGPQPPPPNESIKPPAKPSNVILLFFFCVRQVETELAISALGLDRCLGLGLHSYTANRDSLAFDVLEPVRPQVEEWLLD